MKINQDNFLAVWKDCRIKNIKRPPYFNSLGKMDYMLGQKLVDIVITMGDPQEKEFFARYKNDTYWAVKYKDLIHEPVNYDSLAEIEE